MGLLTVLSALIPYHLHQYHAIYFERLVDVQYALLFASKHCSPRTCSSCAETPWINPSFSATTSPGLNFGIDVVDMVERKERRRKATRRGELLALMTLGRGLNVGQKEGKGRSTPMASTTTLFVS
jgi:hypothetical protein